MTLASRFVRLVFLLGLLAGVLVVWNIALRDFGLARSEVINSIERHIHTNPMLPGLVYEHDVARLSVYLDEQLTRTVALYAGVFDGTGNAIVSRSALGVRSIKPLDIMASRAGLLPMENSVNTRYILLEGGADSWLNRMLPALFSERITDVTIPVVSTINPLEVELNAATLIESWRGTASNRGQFVVGYIYSSISHSALWAQIRVKILWTTLACALALAIVTLGVSYYARYLLGSLAKLAEQAREVASMPIDTDHQFRASGEAKHIANLLNSTMQELKTYRARLNIDRELLNLKVEEQGTLLSERAQQLDQAQTEVSRSQEDLHRMAYYDALTSLPNRRLFTEQLNLMLRFHEREGKLLALMFLDLDKFKRINDSLGHSAGDLLLREVGIRLAGCMRTSDLLGHFAHAHMHVEVSRLGGDEFTLVLHDIRDTSEANAVAERVLKAIGAPMNVDGHELIITPSIGIAIGPTDANTVEGLLKAADTAMYQAKESGKNKHVFYSQEMKTADVKRLILETELRRAIERNELELHYQPMVSLKTGTVVGAEALIRWQHPEQGSIGPDQFIPLAEEMGLIIDIGEWTLHEACRMISGLKPDERAFLKKVSVNVSPLAVSASLPARVESILKETGADPQLLELELTENVLMETHSTPIQALNQLKALGVSLSIDDFGTGYSSLSYLSHFPLDTLKIDRSFVRDFDKSRNNQTLVEAIAAMAFSLDLSVVAEGVETAEQLRFLYGLKVELIQGWFFHRAVPARELGYLLKEGHFMPKVNRAMYSDPGGLTMSNA